VPVKRPLPSTVPKTPPDGSEQYRCAGECASVGGKCLQALKVVPVQSYVRPNPRSCRHRLCLRLHASTARAAQHADSEQEKGEQHD